VKCSDYNPENPMFHSDMMIKLSTSGPANVSSAPKGSGGNIVGRVLNYAVGTIFKISFSL
jgi:hypothetical protein